MYNRTKNGLPSTNNSVEAYNANWNMTCTRKPNLWQTITGFQREDAMSAQKAFENRTGVPSGKNPKRDSQGEQKIATIRHLMENFEVDKDLDNYLCDLLWKI